LCAACRGGFFARGDLACRLEAGGVKSFPGQVRGRSERFPACWTLCPAVRLPGRVLLIVTYLLRSICSPIGVERMGRSSRLSGLRLPRAGALRPAWLATYWQWCRIGDCTQLMGVADETAACPEKGGFRRLPFTEITGNASSRSSRPLAACFRQPPCRNSPRTMDIRYADGPFGRDYHKLSRLPFLSACDNECAILSTSDS